MEGADTLDVRDRWEANVLGAIARISGQPMPRRPWTKRATRGCLRSPTMRQIDLQDYLCASGLSLSQLVLVLGGRVSITSVNHRNIWGHAICDEKRRTAIMAHDEEICLHGFEIFQRIKQGFSFDAELVRISRVTTSALNRCAAISRLFSSR